VFHFLPFLYNRLSDESDGEKGEKSHRGQRKAPLGGVRRLGAVRPALGRRVVQFGQLIDGDEAGVAEGLPVEGAALSAQHDDLGEVLAEAVAAAQVRVQLLPVAVLAEARTVLQDVLDLGSIL
jgi:hypothetical protein